MSGMETIHTKSNILNNAKSLILSKGYRACTVDEICKTSGISKGGFYHYFKSKDDLGITILEHYYNKHLEMLLNGDYRYIKNPIKQVFGFIDHTKEVASQIWSDGCLLACYGNDISEANPQIKHKIEELFDDWIEKYTEAFMPIEQILRKKVNMSTKQLAKNFLAVIEGNIVLAKAYNDPKHISEGIEQFKKNLKVLIS